MRRPRAAEGRRRQEGASDAKARGAAAPRAAGLDPAGRNRARPVFRHRHDRRGGQAARPALYRHRARSRLCRGRRRASRAPRRRADAEIVATPGSARSRASRSAAWSSAACLRPACCSTSATGAGPRGCAPTAASISAEHRGSIHRSAPRCRARRPATAGRSGMSRARASWCRSTAAPEAAGGAALDCRGADARPICRLGDRRQRNGHDPE